MTARRFKKLLRRIAVICYPNAVWLHGQRPDWRQRRFDQYRKFHPPGLVSDFVLCVVTFGMAIVYLAT